ncbi:MAG: hypothetical protein J2P17_36160 [Mycobacterium sp.]|nr:hypothetical protein [Mycobacterium sp.]
MTIVLSIQFSDAGVDPGLVAHWLRPVLPDVMLPDAAGPAAETMGETDWFDISATLRTGRHGVRSVYTEFHHTRNWYEWIEVYESQLPALISPLLGLALAGDGRLLVDEVGLDMTDAELAEIVEYFTDQFVRARDRSQVGPE